MIWVLVQSNDAITLFYLSLVWRDSVGVGVPGRGLNQSVRVIFLAELLCLLRHTDELAKQLSMAIIPPCFGFFRCRVDVLQR